MPFQTFSTKNEGRRERRLTGFVLTNAPLLSLWRLCLLSDSCHMALQAPSPAVIKLSLKRLMKESVCCFFTAAAVDRLSLTGNHQGQVRRPLPLSWCHPVVCVVVKRKLTESKTLSKLESLRSRLEISKKIHKKIRLFIAFFFNILKPV